MITLSNGNLKVLFILSAGYYGFLNITGDMSEPRDSREMYADRKACGKEQINASCLQKHFFLLFVQVGNPNLHVTMGLKHDMNLIYTSFKVISLRSCKITHHRK